MTKQIIDEWFDRGVRQKSEFMIVVCDTFSWDDYPIYTTKENFWEKYESHDYKNMQKIMEVYNLKMNKKEQVKKHRCFNCPPR